MKLSIIIPTKDREKYCLGAINQILGLNLGDFELIIQDNSTTDDLKEIIYKIGSKNIKYNYHPGILSFVNNFSESLSFAEGDYVCMIGDDDGVLPNIMEIVDYSNENALDAVIPSLDATYIWPSDNPIIKNTKYGCLFFGNYRHKVKYVDVKDGIKDLMSKAGQDYQSIDIPRLYHGLIRRSKLQEIKEKTGMYFDGLTPDIYISVALSFVCERVVKLSFPITISGICPRSGSSDSATGKHTGELKDAPHFRGHNDYKWDDKAPYIYSVESIWGETVLHALKNWNKNKLYEAFRVDVLDAICYIKYEQFRPRLMEHAQKYGFSKREIKILALLINFRYKANRIFRAVNNRLTGRQKKFYKIYEVQDIIKASDKIKQIIEGDNL